MTTAQHVHGNFSDAEREEVQALELRKALLRDGVRDDADNHARPLLAELWAELSARKQSSGDESYTRKLLDGGAAKIGEKIREEADELAVAIADESDERVVSEAADELYHLLVGLLHRDVTLRDVEAELARRSGVSGLVEKANRGK